MSLFYLPLACHQERKPNFPHQQAVVETIASAKIPEGFGPDLQSLVDAGAEHHGFHVVTS
jgi:hypothetical protein